MKVFTDTIAKEIDLVLSKNNVPINIEGEIKKRNIKLNKNCVDFADSVLGEIKKDGESYVINIQAFDHYYRKRFTMAYLLITYEIYKPEHKILYKPFSEKSTIIDYTCEKLMPESAIKGVLELAPVINQKGEIDLNILEYLYKKFQVSKTALANRFRQFK